MPVDINKWKETSLDAYLEVSPVNKLGEESGRELSSRIVVNASFAGVQVPQHGLMGALCSPVRSRGWTDR